MADTTSGDIENPNPKLPAETAGGGASSKNDPHKKWKVIALSTFLVAAIVLAIVLGVTLGGSDSSSSNVSTNKEDTIATQPNNETSPSITTTVTATTPNEDKDPTTTDATTATTTTPKLPTDTPSKDDVSAPQVYKAQYLASNGPILANVRMINPGVANGYSSCIDLKEDMRNALWHYANTVIVRERDSSYNDRYEKCDPNNPSQPVWYGIPEDSMAFSMDESTAESVTAPAPEAGGSADAKVKEDSFETNNQVDGVDEGDIVKSDGDYVYAAYGDLLYVWNATDGTKGISITKMPFEEQNKTECSHNYPSKEPFLEDQSIAFPSEKVEEKPDSTESDQTISSNSGTESVQSTSSSSGGQRNRRNRHRRKASSIYWNPCYKPKPRILSLLLKGSRLTTIVSEDNYRGFGYQGGNEEESQPIIDDYSKLTIRVYDISDVPIDGSPLELLGEKEIKGNYDSARSVDNTGFVITTSYINSYLFADDLYRYKPQYCGLDSTEYEKLANDNALKNTEPFLERMVEEMQLQLDGTCDSIFQVSAMQSGDNDEDASDGDMLSQFVQVLSFDMSSTFVDKNIFTNVAGAFSSGWLSSVYASQNFVATLNVGNNYNITSNNWDSATFILGFDISGTVPKPFAYAEVRGSPLNQYSTDLYEGHLRVVTTEFDWSAVESRTTNKMFVLKVPEANEGQEMITVGETGHLGKPNESVMAVRFIGPRAYIVTFERTDPFYIYNLTDPAEPEKLGELEIPGFSSYLHPIEIEGVPFILGVGEHVNATTGRRVGVKISLFDISDPKSPTENATFVDEGAYSSAGNDFKAFRYLPVSKKLILPKSEYTWSDKGNFDGFVVYNVGLGEVTPSYEIEHANSYDMYHGCWYNAYMPARSFVFQSKLTTILSHSVISTDLENGDKLWNMSLDEGLENTACVSYFIGF